MTNTLITGNTGAWYLFDSDTGERTTLRGQRVPGFAEYADAFAFACDGLV